MAASTTEREEGDDCSQDEWWTPVNIVGESEVHEDEVVMKGLEGS